MYEEKALLTVAELMSLAARTAPKTRGMDCIMTHILIGDEREQVAAEMERYGKEHEMAFFQRDAGCLRLAPVAVIIAARSMPARMKDCSQCGGRGCDVSTPDKVTCAFNHIDLGIAVGSAVAVASLHHVDNRIMYSIGKAARTVNLFGYPAISALGIPLSATGKNPFFDRG